MGESANRRSVSIQLVFPASGKVAFLSPQNVSCLEVSIQLVFPASGKVSSLLAHAGLCSQFPFN